MAFDKKYRPKKFKSFIGNGAVIELLEGLFEEIDSFPSSIMFTGPSGCGKTTLARIVANILGGELHELNISKSRGINDARQIIDNVRISSITEKRKIIVLNECHKATNEFQNAMLEVLEEPPKNVNFILCTTEPQRLLNTIRTRCVIITVRKLVRRELKKIVKKVLGIEGMDLDGSVLNALINASGGVPRVLLNALQSVLASNDKNYQMEIIDNFGIDESNIAINEFCQGFLKGYKYNQMMAMAKKLRSQDVESVRRAVLGYMSAVLTNKNNPIAAIVIENFLDPYYDSGDAGFVYSVWSTLEELNEK